MCAQPATHLCRRCATAAVTRRPLEKQPPWAALPRPPAATRCPRTLARSFVNVQFSTWCYLCLLPFFKKDQNLYWLKSPSRAFYPTSRGLLEGRGPFAACAPHHITSHTLTDVANCNTIVTVYPGVRGRQNHNLMNFSAPCERGKWPRLLPPSSFSAHMSLNSSDWIELCNCFDFWPRAFIFPLFLSHFHRLHPTLPYIMTSRIYRLCGKNVINNSRCFIALQQLNLYGPAFEVLPLFADILARSHPHFGLVLLCVSFPIKHTQIDDVNNDATKIVGSMTGRKKQKAEVCAGEPEQRMANWNGNWLDIPEAHYCMNSSRCMCFIGGVPEII